jgi:hypothetical protein
MGTSIGGSVTYFAIDGNYGDAHGILVADTSTWTQDDWDRIEMAGDMERLAVAVDIANQYR